MDGRGGTGAELAGAVTQLKMLACGLIPRDSCSLTNTGQGPDPDRHDKQNESEQPDGKIFLGFSVFNIHAVPPGRRLFKALYVTNDVSPL